MPYGQSDMSVTVSSRAEFAQRIDVSLDTIRNWEQGKRSPTGAAKALLNVLDQAHEAALAALHERHPTPSPENRLQAVLVDFGAPIRRSLTLKTSLGCGGSRRRRRWGAARPPGGRVRDERSEEDGGTAVPADWGPQAAQQRDFPAP